MVTFATENPSLNNGMHGKNARRPWLLKLRSSKAFVTSVVSYSVFAVSSVRHGIIEAQTAQDQFVFAVIVPVMPFTLHDRAGVSEASGKVPCPTLFLDSGR